MSEREITVQQAVREALDEEIARDPDVIVLGQDLGVYGGAFGVTAGLLDKYGPTRVRETPISEASMMGLAVGAALMGLRPVVEFMFMDFMTLAMDQLANHAAKISFMYGGQRGVPLVVRAPFGAGRGYGVSHSQSLESWFVNVPGLKVVIPSTPADAKGLLKAAIRDDNPVVFLEHKLVYSIKGLVDDMASVPALSGSRVLRVGTDVTLIGYGQQVVMLSKVAEELAGHGIRAEVVDVRVLKPLDMDTIAASVRKTRRAVIVEEGTELCSVGSELAQQIYTRCFGELAGPVVKFSGRDTPIPAALNLERAYLPQPGDVVACVQRMLGTPASMSGR
jgi:pyruvate/2-oxoglutarate/acetoin dehydrogenase E1 component